MIKESSEVLPRTTIEDESLYYAIGIAKKGYYCGNPENVLNAPVSMILSILNYETFENDYKQTYAELNKNG